MATPGFATSKDLAVMADQDEAWMNTIDPANIPPLPDNWEEHPFWADGDAVANPETATGKAILDMQQACTPCERSETCKVCHVHSDSSETTKPRRNTQGCNENIYDMVHTFVHHNILILLYMIELP